METLWSRNTILRYVSAVALIGLSSCAIPFQQSEDSRARAALEQQILQDVERIKPRLLQPHPASDATLQYSAEYANKYNYDIRKTDSIVSPYAANVEYYLNWYANGKPAPANQHVDASYGYTDGKWAFQSAKFVSGGQVQPQDRQWANSLFEVSRTN